MKKIIVLVISAFLISIVFSCKGKYEKSVYFDLKIGGSKADAEKFYEKFRNENNPNKDSKYPFFRHSLENGKSYYSSPLFLFQPNDTIVHTVEVYYFINPVNGDKLLNQTKEGLLSMQIDNNYEEVSPAMVFNDVLKELEAKYGKSDNTDSINYKKPTHLIKNWKNKDGINITLDYASNEEYFFEAVKYYNIKLQFTLTDELKTSLIKNKSIY